jgi:hypothetical protein
MKWEALYTKQLTKKAKSWQDGFFEVVGAKKVRI